MKKILIVIITLSAVAGTSAFSPKQEKSKAHFSQYWYKLITNGDPGNYLDYERVGSQPCSGATTNVCGVFAEQYSASDIEHPNLGLVATTVYKP